MATRGSTLTELVVAMVVGALVLGIGADLLRSTIECQRRRSVERRAWTRLVRCRAQYSRDRRRVDDAEWSYSGGRVRVGPYAADDGEVFHELERSGSHWRWWRRRGETSTLLLDGFDLEPEGEWPEAWSPSREIGEVGEEGATVLRLGEAPFWRSATDDGVTRWRPARIRVAYGERVWVERAREPNATLVARRPPPMVVGRVGLGAVSLRMYWLEPWNCSPVDGGAAE
ncbi:MAG: hypothetical protein KDC38_18775 [Planctomycetes bacterium]|nr:hypothetical protein [Planctomycetota bacterium]